MRNLGRNLLLLALLTLAAPAGAAREFPTPVHPDTLPTLIQAWTVPASLSPYVTNAYAPRLARKGMVLFVYDHHGRRLAAVDAATGNVKWHQPIPSRSDQAFAFTPLVVRSRVYVACDGFLYAFNTQDGKKVMQLPTKGIAINELGRSKHRVFLPWIRTQGTRAQPGVQVWAIDTRSGRVEWTQKYPGTMGFVLGNADGPYYISNGGVVLGLTPDRGEPRWQVRVKGQVLSPPILEDGRIYITALRRKAGWVGHSVYVIDAKEGKLLWQKKLAASKVHVFLVGNKLATVDNRGKLMLFDGGGKKEAELTLRFSDEPTTLRGTAVGDRVFVFSSHPDHHGYVWLVDMAKKKVLTAANALDMGIRSLLPAEKMLFMDGVDGNVYAYRLDKSQRPKRLTVPPDEFAREMLARVANVEAPISGLASKLAGLGPKALPAIEAGLKSPNPYVVDVAARAIGYLDNRRSAAALVEAIKRLSATPADPKYKVDPLLPVLKAAAELADGRAAKALQQVLSDGGQGHMRRRLAYVALGAIGSPVSLGPIWSYRAANQVATMNWDPMALTPSYAYKVEEDVAPPTAPEAWPEEVRKATTMTIQTKEGKVYTAALSPYLGGYNDVWVGQSDLSGWIQQPWFTGLTKPEVEPNKRIRIKKFSVDAENKATLGIEIKQDDGWVAARPVEVDLRTLAEDFDKDKLPDVVERRLHTCITNSDCDGDGLADNEDLNPLASGKQKLTVEQELFREAFFTYFSFLQRRGLVVVDPGDGPSYELYGRKDPILSLRRPTMEKFRKDVGLHAVDFVTFGGPYPEGGGSGDALPEVAWNKKKTMATVGMDIFRSGENAVAYNVTLKKVGRKWVVVGLDRIWTTNN